MARNMEMLSPYYLISSAEEDALVQKLEQQLLFYSPSPSTTSIPFLLLAEKLEEAYNTNSIAIKQNIAYNLIHETFHYARENNPSLCMFALLRLCFPPYDNRSVYGFKSHKLLKSFAKAFEKSGSVNGRKASSKLLAWIKRPTPTRNKSSTLISMPEVEVARAHALCFPATRKPSKQLTILDIAAMCQRLTNMYKEKHKDALVMVHNTAVKVDKIAEFLATELPHLSYVECKVLVRILLRTISLGIGLKTFTGVLPALLQNQMDYQMDLCRLSIEMVKALEGQPLRSTVLCGVPFRPMTCQVVSSPYVMKWLFSKEETFKSYLPPKDGQLIMHPNGKWYVPLKRGNSKQRKRFVDLETASSTQTSHVKKHMELLGEIKRNRHLFFNEEYASGMVISYMITRGETDGAYFFLVRGMKLIEEDEEIEFADADIHPAGAKKDSITQFLVSTEPQPISHHITITACTLDPEKQTKGQKINGMIVQRKYDGDRMQAHLGLSPQIETPKIQLFSKSGKPVQHLYTDVYNEMMRKLSENGVNSDLPCILDGEIIVVDAEQNPLPWSSMKWRYDSGQATPLTTTPLISGNAKPTIVSVVSEEKYCENTTDGETSELTLAPLMNLKSWDQIGGSEKEKIRVKVLEGAQLLYVVFDVLMIKGRLITDQPYSERLKRLKELRFLSSLKYSKVIPDSTTLQNAQELVTALTQTVRDHAEGLILKDPRAKYVCGRTNTQRKLKISGPDINCEVVGLGFTLTRNPRMWGILTAILSEDKSEYLVYNRVESIEGDAPSTAAEYILSLPSCVSVEACSANTTVTTERYSILITQNADSEALRITWKPKDEESRECTLCFMQGLPQDIQWLCNPLECLFGVSQRGDLHPVSGGVPRFPVCRIQWDDHQRSECDTPSSIRTKFEQASALPTCIQDFMKRRIRQLRSKPPVAEKLEEIRRILLGKENQMEAWPQKIDGMYTLAEFSALLEKNGFEPLTQGERHVLSGLKPQSQWDNLLVKKVRISIDSEYTITKTGEREATLPFLALKLSRFIDLINRGKFLKPISSSSPPQTSSQIGFTEKEKKVEGEKIPSKEEEEEEKNFFTLPLIPPFYDDDDDDEYEDNDDGNKPELKQEFRVLEDPYEDKHQYYFSEELCNDIGGYEEEYMYTTTTTYDENMACDFYNDDDNDDD